MPERIGVIGTGDVGHAIASGFAARGHDVMMGSRDPDKPEVQEWVKAHASHARAGTNAEVAAFGDVVVLATAWSGTENALRLADPANLAGKVVMDVTNPLTHDADGNVSLALGHTDSGGEQVQRWLPDARVVKTLNIVNNHDMVAPRFGDAAPDMLLCGNDADAKRQVEGYLRAFGWTRVIDLGGLEGARLMESLCLLWVNVGAATGRSDHAFKIVHRVGA